MDSCCTRPPGRGLFVRVTSNARTNRARGPLVGVGSGQSFELALRLGRALLSGQGGQTRSSGDLPTQKMVSEWQRELRRRNVACAGGERAPLPRRAIRPMKPSLAWRGAGHAFPNGRLPIKRSLPCRSARRAAVRERQATRAREGELAGVQPSPANWRIMSALSEFPLSDWPARQKLPFHGTARASTPTAARIAEDGYAPRRQTRVVAIQWAERPTSARRIAIAGTPFVTPKRLEARFLSKAPQRLSPPPSQDGLCPRETKPRDAREPNCCRKRYRSSQRNLHGKEPPATQGVPFPESIPIGEKSPRNRQPPRHRAADDGGSVGSQLRSWLPATIFPRLDP